MYPISEELRELFQSENKQIALITMETQNETVVITDSDVISGTLSVDRYCVSGNKIEIGSAIAAEINFKLNNEDGKYNDVLFEGAELFVQIGVKDWSNPESDEFYIPLGYFTVDTTPRKLSTISITALDRMVRFDKPWDSAITFPATISELITDACDNCNVPIHTILSGLPNYNYSVPLVPNEDNLTYRQIIQWCAEIMGACAYIDWDGELRIEWFGETDIEFTTSNRYSSDLYENVITITGVSAEVEGMSYLSGTDAYAFNISENGLLQTNIESALSSLGETLTGFSYTPFKAVTKSAPYIYPLDIASYVDKNNVSHRVIITNATFTMNKNTSFAGKGETAVNNSYAMANPLTNRQKNIIETIKRDTNVALNSRVQTLSSFNDLICNAMGVYSTSVLQLDGSYKYYLHDSPNLESSNTIWTMTENGFAYTNSGWNNGNPVWEYGLDKEGNAIFKSVSAYGVEVSDPNQDYSAQMIPTGFDIFYKTDKVLTVNEKRTEITDVLVKRRLESGKIQFVPNDLGADFIYIGG